MEEILPPRFSRRIFYASTLSSISVVTALAYGQVVSAGLVAIVTSTSLMYWHRPTPGFRRGADIACVTLCGIYQFFLSIESVYQQEYAVLVLASIACYIMSARYHEDQDTSAWLHVFLHIFANLSNIAIYTGIPPRKYPAF